MKSSRGLSQKVKILSIACLLSGVLQGCLKKEPVEDSSEQSKTGCCASDQGTTGLSVPEKPQELRVSAVPNVRQVFESMKNSIGVMQPSSETRTYFLNNSTNFGKSGTPDEVNASMQMTTSTLALYLCNDLYAKEMNLAPEARTFFGTLPMTSDGVVFSNFQDEIFHKFAGHVWGRNPAMAERQIIVSGLSNMNLGNGRVLTRAEVRIAANTVCTSVLSSLSGQEF